MSRTVSDTDGGLMLFGRHEKNVFAKQLRRHAAFAGVEVLTWCMMDNHFHLLVRVPDREEFLASLMADGRRRFWQHLRILYHREQVAELRGEVKTLERGGEAGATRLEELLGSYTRRMADLSEFVRSLKLAFSVWFNSKHGRRGTLWMDRFKSVLLEGEDFVLKKVAAYIDLNPIRAGMVEDPGLYPWSGYGEAMAGHREARRGLSAVYGCSRDAWRAISKSYRGLLFEEGVEIRRRDGPVVGRATVPGVASGEPGVARPASGSKRLSRRVRSFSRGAAIGSREFLEEVFERYRDLFGPARQSGSRPLRGRDWKGEGMFALRDVEPG